MIKTFDPVVNGIGGVKLKIFPEVVSAELSEFGHAAELPSSPERCNLGRGNRLKILNVIWTITVRGDVSAVAFRGSHVSVILVQSL